MNATRASAVLGALLAVGVIAAAWMVSDAVLAVKQSQRTVQVKGLAEREVPANLALWSLAYTTSADKLDVLHARLSKDADAIHAFLLKHGFTDDEIQRAPPDVTDRDSTNRNNKGLRYRAQAVTLVRSHKVQAVRSAQQQTSQLVAEGISLNRNYQYPTKYLFTKLNTIKPAMIAEATRNARKAAEQFARDSGSKVGAIRHARQGYFSIENRDRLSPQIKRVRVVTTVDYFLVD